MHVSWFTFLATSYCLQQVHFLLCLWLFCLYLGPLSCYRLASSSPALIGGFVPSLFVLTRSCWGGTTGEPIFFFFWRETEEEDLGKRGLLEWLWGVKGRETAVGMESLTEEQKKIAVSGFSNFSLKEFKIM